MTTYAAPDAPSGHNISTGHNLDTTTFAHLIIAIEKAMQKVEASALAAGATQAQAAAAANQALQNHLAEVADMLYLRPYDEELDG